MEQQTSLLNEEAAPPAEAEQTAPVEQPNRPEWLPEKFNTPEDLANSYNELQKKLGAKEEDLKNSLKNELLADRPEAADKYEIPEDVDVTDPQLQWWANTAFERGMSQEEFTKGIDMAREIMASQLPNLDEEAAKLGDNANERIDAASAYARANFDESMHGAISRLFESHEGVLLMERIMEMGKGSTLTPEGGSAPQGMTLDDLKEMQKDDRYGLGNPAMRDTAYVKKVDEAFRNFYARKA